MADSARDIVPVRRALLSVYDKTGLIEFAALLSSLGVELISTGGTAKAIRESSIPVLDVADVTGFPECFGGRVKTLHPLVHGGLLFERDDDEHVQTAGSLGIAPIDLLMVNLYPFANTIAKAGVTFREANENIDIGGPAMIRGAAKNHAHVAVMTDPVQYAAVGAEIREKGGTTLWMREVLKVDAYRLTADYDALIANYLKHTFDTPPWR